jgi:hypothetical protein
MNKIEYSNLNAKQKETFLERFSDTMRYQNRGMRMEFILGNI